MAHVKTTHLHLPKEFDPSAAATSPAVNILIAYPKDLTGRLIAETLNRNGNYKVAAHASSASAVMAFAKHLTIHVALIAASLVTPNDGIDIIRRLSSAHSSSRTVILLDAPDPQVTLDAFRAGAMGAFCMSRNGYNVLCECIQCVIEGQMWATPQRAESVLRIDRPF